MDPRLAMVRDHVRAVPDFPKPGILFRDITPMLAEPRALHAAIELLAERYRPLGIEQIVAIESRGFIFGAPLALELQVGLHLVRKPGKLPGTTDEVAYDLEYGSNTLQIHKGQLPRGARTLIVDDLLAPGGTAAAAGRLVEQQGACVAECAFIVELDGLDGRSRLSWPMFALLPL